MSQYNARQDSVEVILLYKETEELRNQYLFAAIGGKGPDLFYGPADNIGTLSITETARPLEDLLPARFVAGFDTTGLLRYDGHLLGVADQIGNHLTLVYNTKLLPEPPRTLGALDSLGARFPAGGSPVSYALTWNYTEPFFFIPFLTSFGGWVMDDAGNPTLDTPEMVKAIQYVLDLRDKYHVIPRESDYETANTLFKDGASAAIINGPWSWAGYGEAGVDYALAPIPFNTETGLWAQPMAAAKAYSLNPGVPDWKLPARPRPDAAPHRRRRSRPRWRCASRRSRSARPSATARSMARQPDPPAVARPDRALAPDADRAAAPPDLGRHEGPVPARHERPDHRPRRAPARCRRTSRSASTTPF